MPNGKISRERKENMPNGKISIMCMKVVDSESLGQIIRERRKKLKYTQNYLAEFTGLSVTFISDVERGKKTAEIGKVMQLLNTLGLDIFIERRG